MSRIPTPADIADAPAAARPLLEAVHRQFGVTPNLYKIASNSPAALDGLLGLTGALAKGALDVRTRERLALAVAEANGCGYCLAAHSYLAKNLAKLADAEIVANRSGGSADAKADAALRFAVRIVEARGHVGESEIAAVKTAGYSDAQIVEIVAHVALNTFTNYVNEAFQTAIDFPLAVPFDKAA
jgi:uncharacterized peroxidase-related enzyme